MQTNNEKILFCQELIKYVTKRMTINNTSFYPIKRFLLERMIFIIKARFGIGCPPMTYKEIGNIIHLTSERIRQIENKFLRISRQFVNEEEIKIDDFYWD